MAKKRQRAGPCPKKFQILVGQHQKGDGRLIVLRDFGTNRFGKRIWLCGCDCGGHAVVSTSHFLSGHTKSCGCLQREIAAKIGKGNCSRRCRFSGQFARIAVRSETLPANGPHPSVKVAARFHRRELALRRWGNQSKRSSTRFATASRNP
jgi:hypothetical protein